MPLRTEEERRRVRYRRMLRPTVQYWRRVGLTIFIIWHLFAIAMWLMPSSYLESHALTVVRPYMTATGFMQGWNMFAPNPWTEDLYVEAQVHYADGTERTYTFPRMERLSIWRRYQKERWRKYIEVAQQDGYSFLWPAMAKFAARSIRFNAANPPVTVDLVRHYRIIQAPGVAILNWHVVTFDTERIRPEDLH
jgi:hypothetical protein